MVFPDDEREANPATFKFLAMAHKWKMQQQSGADSQSTFDGFARGTDFDEDDDEDDQDDASSQKVVMGRISARNSGEDDMEQSDGDKSGD